MISSVNSVRYLYETSCATLLMSTKYHTTENYIIKKEKELEEKRLEEQKLKEQRLEEQRLKELNEKYGENESLIIFLLIITIFLILLLIYSVY